MEELGFAPQAEAAGGGGKYRLCLRQCPFREVAQHHQEVICSLHLGLMRGALARTLAPVTADRLDPFVKPSLCVARLTARDHPGERQPAPAGTRYEDRRALLTLHRRQATAPAAVSATTGL